MATDKKSTFSDGHNDLEPCISPKGEKFYFASKRTSKNKNTMKNDIDIWEMDRIHNGWTEPKILEGTINSECMEYYPSVSKNGNLYFGRNDLDLTRGDIYISQKTNEEFTASKKLSSKINLLQSSFNSYISPDETFIIFSAYVQDSLLLNSDLFIRFRDEQNNWENPINLGDEINSKYNDISPWISYDKRFLFFSSTRLDTTGDNENYDIFWVSAEIIDNYRHKN